jgi:hypothetical protein
MASAECDRGHRDRDHAFQAALHLRPPLWIRSRWQSSADPAKHVREKFMRLREHFDAGSLLVMAITFALSAMSLCTAGFTHDILLDAGVFLVSVALLCSRSRERGHLDDRLDHAWTRLQ